MDNTCCLCSAVHLLTKNYDDEQAQDLIPTLNRHLKDIHLLLTTSKSLYRGVQYQITPKNERRNKVLTIDSVDHSSVDQVWDTFKENVDRFWVGSINSAHIELRRRLGCVVVFLRSILDAQASVPPHIAQLFPGPLNYVEVRNAGRKYIKIARKLGGLGAICWLPLDIPHSTYERYLNLEDEEVFSHLLSLRPKVEHLTDFVQRLVLCQLRDSSLSSSYYNLAVGYGDFLPPSDQLILLLYALGGSDIPDVLLKAVQSTQRRWNEEGEMESISTSQFELPVELVSLLSDEIVFRQIMESSYITKSALEDSTITWSLRPEMRSFFSNSLHPQTMNDLGVTVLKLICFACPPCYEGNTHWSRSLKRAVWSILEWAASTYKIPVSLQTQVLEAMLYFSERDFIPMRQAATEQARKLLRKSMPYYLHASVVLFQSILYRVGGEFAKSEARIRDFMWRGPKPSTRLDHALQGRLHISQIENKIKCHDNDVPSIIYQWEATQPLSTLDIEVTFRLQSTATRFFQSVGDFGAAKASLEQFLCLDTTKPIRPNTRRLLVGRLADIYCEMQECAKAVEILQPELDRSTESDRPRRWFQRLLLASVEANIGLGRMDAAEATLKELGDSLPLTLDDIHDEQLHMRRLISTARIAHIQTDYTEAVARWKYALREVQQMQTLKSGAGFTAAVIYLSLAHAQLRAKDRDGGRHSWATGLEILRSEKCEFWLPVVPTAWLHRVAVEAHEWEGWSFRMMLPGGKPDIVI